ncbi:hypothetical protein BC829DRAFT_389529 [Chytridium lagenaria]|nr:hypothetical protein BC829DRAFT_389529 [Chytridium lagenaria]
MADDFEVSFLKLHTIGVSETAAPALKQVDVDVCATVYKSSSDDFPLHGISLKYLHQFAEACGGHAALEGLSTQDVCTKFIIPATQKTGTSACDILLSFDRQDAVSKATWFVSHVWRYHFLDVLDALDSFFSDQEPESTFVWFDLFTNSQHNTSKRPVEWWKTTFMNALYACRMTNSNFNVAMTRAEEQRFVENVSNDAAAFYKMLATIQSSKATAMSLSDRDDIFRVIEENTGFTELDRLLLSGKNDTRLGENHGGLLTCLNNLGLYDKAELLFVDGLERTKNILGEDHPDTLTSLHNLAALYNSLTHYDKAVPLKKRVQGEDYPDTLTTLNNLALVYFNQGIYDKAEPLFLECVNRRKSTLGENHPDTLNTLHNFALLYNNQGLFDKAALLLVNCVKGKTRVLGPDHPDTLDSLGSLAHLYAIKTVSKEKKRVLGEDHPNTFSFSHQGFYDKAERLNVDYLDRTTRILGEDHPETLTSLRSLSLLYANQGLYEKAEPLHLDCLERTKRIAGRTMRTLFVSLNNLALLYANQGFFDKARTLRTKRVLGDSHPSVINPINNLAMLYSNQGHYAKAEPLYVDCFEKAKGTLGEDHPNTLKNYETTWLFSSLPYMSNKVFTRRLKRYMPTALRGGNEETRLGKDHFDTLISLDNLAHFYNNQSLHDMAEPLYIDCLTRKRSVLGEDHPNLAAFYFHQGLLVKAEPLQVEVLERTKHALLLVNNLAKLAEPMLKLTLGEDHWSTLASLNSLYDKAKALYADCLERRKRVLGEDHPDTLIKASTDGAWCVIM